MDYDQAIKQIAEYLSLTDDAIAVAEGWSILPENAQRHVIMLINDYVGKLHPDLEVMYANSSRVDQTRFNRIIEKFQDEVRVPPPDDTL